MKFATVESLWGGMCNLSAAPKFLHQESNNLENARDSKDPRR